MADNPYVALIQRYFPQAQWENAYRVMMAESTGNPRAHNTKGEDSRGLFQINVVPAANPQYASVNLFDPETNVRVAGEIYGRSGWRPWTTAVQMGLADQPAAPARETAMAEPIGGDPWGTEEEPKTQPTKIVRNGMYVWVDKLTGKDLWVEGPVEQEAAPVEPVRVQYNDGSIHWFDKNTGRFLWTERVYDESNDPRLKQPEQKLSKWEDPQTGEQWLLDEQGNKVKQLSGPVPGYVPGYGVQAPERPQRLAPRYPEEEELAQLNVAKARQGLMPSARLGIEQEYETIAAVEQMVATGRMTPKEGDEYIALVRANTAAGLRGTTPYQEQTTRRNLGRDLIGDRLAAGTSIGGSLVSAATSLAGRGMYRPGQDWIDADPLQWAKAFVNDVGGGQEVGDYAKSLLMGAGPSAPAQATNPAITLTADEVNRRLGRA